MAGHAQARAVQLACPRIVVGIDFGTHSSGFAYALAIGPGASGSGAAGLTTHIREHTAWPDHPLPRYPKTRTALLYKGKVPVPGAFGYTAIRRWTSLTAAERQDGSHTLIYGTCMKLGLNSPAEAVGLPPGVSALTAAADFLSELRKYAAKQLVAVLPARLGSAATHIDIIQWCLTVPAQWSDAAKASVRTAALRAGMIVKLDSEKLSIVLEPEAAALESQVNGSTTLDVGDVFMIVDAGGGTVDITVHSVEQRGGECMLAECVAAAGAYAGSTYVDRAFEEWAKGEVGPAAWEAFKARDPAAYQTMLNTFEAIKCSFNPGASTLTAPQRVPILPSLHALIKPDDLAMLKVEHSDHDLLLENDALQKFFEPVVADIIHLVTTQLDRLAGASPTPGNRSISNSISNGGMNTSTNQGTSAEGLRCNKVLLVGGFAASPYLQARVKEALGRRVQQVFVPDTPYATVLKGAVLCGQRPDLIHARRSRLTYGLRACAPYIDGAPGKFWHHTEQCYYTDRIFSTFVRKNDRIGCNEVVDHFFVPLYKEQTTADIELYGGSAVDLEYVEDVDGDNEVMHKIADLSMDLSSVPDSPRNAGQESLIRVQLRFGRTEMQVEAQEEGSGARVATSVRFAHF